MREDFIFGAVVIWVTFAAATGIAGMIGAVFGSIVIISFVFISYGFGTDVKTKEYQSDIKTINTKIENLSLKVAQLADDSRIDRLEARLLFPDYVSICRDLFGKLEQTSQERALASSRFKKVFKMGNENPSSFDQEDIEYYVFKMNMCLEKLSENEVEEFRRSSGFETYRKVTEIYS